MMMMMMMMMMITGEESHIPAAKCAGRFDGLYS